MKKIKVLGQMTPQNVCDYDYVLPFINKDNKLCFGLDSVVRGTQKNGGTVSENGLDFIILGTMVYFADKYVSRKINSQDSWTRELELTVPVCDVVLWDSTKENLTSMLNFLTGDIWDINFIQRTSMLKDIIGLQNIELIDRQVDVVSLFSGGMDSLISTVNYLSDNKKMLLISHASDPTTRHSQNKVLAKLVQHFGSDNFSEISLWSNFSTIKTKETEKTTRSRSFLFISLAVFVSQSFNTVKQIEIPENGFIALNIPLDVLRVGAYTTRTTHPYYLNLWNRVLDIHKYGFKINNNYLNKTKGEMVLECRDQHLLSEIIPFSISCSSPTKARYQGLPPDTHCGHCVPCIVRRAAIQKGFGFNHDKTQYMYGIDDLINVEKDCGLQLKSFMYAIYKLKKNPKIAKVLIYNTGELKGGTEYIKQLVGVYTRGLLEVDSLITGGQENDTS